MDKAQLKERLLAVLVCERKHKLLDAYNAEPWPLDSSVASSSSSSSAPSPSPSASQVSPAVHPAPQQHAVMQKSIGKLMTMEGVNDSMEDPSVMWSDSNDSEETEDEDVNEEELVESDTAEGAREPLPSTPDSAASRSSSSSSSSSSVAAAAASRYNTRGYGPAVHTRVCIALYSSSDERDLPQRQQEKLHVKASMARTRKLKAKRPFFSDLIPLLVFLLLYLSQCPSRSGNKNAATLS
jgi:cobalamin biosynthesis Mg chelatase CobN